MENRDPDFGFSYLPRSFRPALACLLTQFLEAADFGFDETAAVVADPFLADRAAQFEPC